VTVSEALTDSKDLAFDGRIQLNGDAAPELEVVVRFDDQFIILGHSSGELGRWDRNTVQVAPIGRGWFTLDVEEETVTFLPRRPGHFAASTVDLVPVEETKKRRWRRRPDKQEKAAETQAPGRKERKQLRRDEAARVAVDPVAPTPESPRPTEPGEPDREYREPQPAPVDQTRTHSPEMHASSAVPVAEPSSPWDELPVPDIPGRKSRDKQQPGSVPYSAPRPDRKKKPKPTRAKPAKPSKVAKTKAPKAPRGRAVELAGSSRTVTPVGPKKKNVLSRGFAGFWHGLKGMALRVSDELRQTGIVPFDRLPAAPARARPSESHQHDFQEHRLPGGLTRNVCHECGLVSIGELSGND
jgi:hypothetical protein